MNLLPLYSKLELTQYAWVSIPNLTFPFKKSIPNAAPLTAKAHAFLSPYNAKNAKCTLSLIKKRFFFKTLKNEPNFCLCCNEASKEGGNLSKYGDAEKKVDYWF